MVTEKHIRNLDRIRQMSVEELAPLLVRETCKGKKKDAGDGFYVSPSGLVCGAYEKALADSIQWLDAEYVGNCDVDGQGMPAL